MGKLLTLSWGFSGVANVVGMLQPVPILSHLGQISYVADCSLLLSKPSHAQEYVMKSNHLRQNLFSYQSGQNKMPYGIQ